MDARNALKCIVMQDGAAVYSAEACKKYSNIF